MRTLDVHTHMHTDTYSYIHTYIQCRCMHTCTQTDRQTGTRALTHPHARTSNGALLCTLDSTWPYWLNSTSGGRDIQISMYLFIIIITISIIIYVKAVLPLSSQSSNISSSVRLVILTFWVSLEECILKMWLCHLNSFFWIIYL
jgi:hypothetical protein